MPRGFDDDPDAEFRRERARARELRASAWWKHKRSAGICHYCGKNVGAAAITMDHIVPLAKGGKSTKGNVVPACKTCNNDKKSSLAFEWSPRPPDDSDPNQN